MATPEDMSYSAFCKLSQKLKDLLPSLPSSLPSPTKKDSNVAKIFTKIKVPIHLDEGRWMAFNRRFDALYPITSVDENGVLNNLERGKWGVAMVVDYLVSTAQEDKTNKDFPWPVAMVRAQRLYDSFKALW